MTNLRLSHPASIPDLRKLCIIGAAVLMLGPMAALPVLGAEARVSEGFEPFDKPANERVAQAFEDIQDHRASISDELKTALASLSQRVESAQRPPVQAEGND